MQTDSADFQQIVWGEPALHDSDAWNAAVEVVRMLCSLGKVTKWQEGTKGRDTYIKMASWYEINGLQVEFLPNWNFYTVGGVDLNVPKTVTEITQAVESVKVLLGLGFRPGKK